MLAPLLRVIVVDDHAGFRRVAVELLRARGYEVVGEAGSAASAFELVERLAPDAIMLDVRLGDENGFEVAHRLTRSHPGVAVLLVSADSEQADAERVRAVGARGFLAKAKLARVDLAEFWRRSQRSPAAAWAT